MTVALYMSATIATAAPATMTVATLVVVSVSHLTPERYISAIPVCAQFFGIMHENVTYQCPPDAIWD
jgi:hypothetical protein